MKVRERLIFTEMVEELRQSGYIVDITKSL